jgi:hypothetical protein
MTGGQKEAHEPVHFDSRQTRRRLPSAVQGSSVSRVPEHIWIAAPPSGRFISFARIIRHTDTLAAYPPMRTEQITEQGTAPNAHRAKLNGRDSCWQFRLRVARGHWAAVEGHPTALMRLSPNQTVVIVSAVMILVPSPKSGNPGWRRRARPAG